VIGAGIVEIRLERAMNTIAMEGGILPLLKMKRINPELSLDEPCGFFCH